MHKRQITILTTIIITIISIFLLANSNVSKKNMPYSQIPYCVVSPKIPASIEFAGKEIDITQQDRRERMDREIMAFTYSHINTMLQIKRANRLFPVIEPILKECGIPDDFKYLMIIESNGDIYARSTVGAGGLWQFMESTGKQYGLEINKEIDERYHIEKATRAACKYLRKGYEEYENWMTVAASYNAGTASISKRIEAQQERDGMNLALVPETSRYLFRLLAAKALFSDPVNYGFILQHHDLYPPLPISKEISVNKAVINWPDIAKKHGLSFLQLREANPWIRSTKLNNTKRKSYKVLIPDSMKLHYDPEETSAHNPKWVIR